MASFLADQNFEDQVVAALIALGHDAVTARAVGLANVDDSTVLAAATAASRAVLTHDRDFRLLHRANSAHAGIVLTTIDTDFVGLAARIHAVVAGLSDLAGRLVRVTRPHPSQVP